MSDVEDYAYSPYDDLEDILYDADPAPELADDLADHAIHSPVYQDEDAVKNELQEYFSDWEYYSDDFMDDDPVLLRKNPQDGGSLKSRQDVKRGKKRKLVETQDIPPLDLDEDQLLTRCIKGTIWAKPLDLNTPSYKDGQEKKVALMKDWKQAFASKENGWGRSSAKEDESWANNMSLADMGLRNLPRQSSFEQTTQETEAEFEEDEEGAEEMAADLLEEIMPLKNHSGRDSSKLRNNVLLEEDDGGGETAQAPSESEGSDEIPRKRRRVEPTLPSPPNSNESVAADSAKPKVLQKLKAAVSPNEDPFMDNSEKDVQVKAPVPTGRDTQQRQKRKATEEPEDSGTRSTASRRVKRIASTAAEVNQSAPPAPRSNHSTRTK